MTLSVLGIGLTSPAGASARDHVFFPRAEAPPPPPSPFRGLDGRRVHARYCPWIPGFEAAASRMAALAFAAVDEALAALPVGTSTSIPIFLVTPAARTGLLQDEIAGLARALQARTRAPAIHLLTGAAGAFAALAQTATLFAGGQLGAALVVGVDSFACVDALTERAQRPASPWLVDPPPPGEGAAALLLASPDQARRWGVVSLGDITASSSAMGRATDTDDEPVDAAAMTSLLRGLPGSAPIQRVFGQNRTGLLRLREWAYTSARCVDRFAPSCREPCLEAEIGELGAAAGVANLAFAFAVFRHGAVLPPAPIPGIFLAWAISRDGSRGLALGAAARPAPGAIAPLGDTATARRIERELFTPSQPEPEHDPFDEATVSEGTDLDFTAMDAAANDIAHPLPPLPERIAPSPLIQLDPERAEAQRLPAFYASVVGHCAELAAALARDRLGSSFAGLPATEARLLRQLDAIFTAGPRALIESVNLWESRLADPWTGFACALSIAGFEGDDALTAIHHVIHLLPDDAEAPAIMIAEALSLSGHAGLAALARSLFESPHVLARAIGTSLLSTRGELDEESLRAALVSSADPIVRAAIWACERLPTAAREPWLGRLRDHTRSSSADVAWSATRVLVVSGDRDVWADATEGTLGERLGPRAAELYVLCGAPRDWPRFESLLGRHRTTPALLSAVARFGSPAAAPWLLQRLDDDALGEPAVLALQTLFGAIVPPERQTEAGLWRSAIAGLGLDPQACCRRGLPWSAAVVADECAEGTLSRSGIELRIDELRARLRLPEAVDVSGWWRSTNDRLTDFLGRARSRG